MLTLLLVACAIQALACTSAIVSGRLTANGRPLMWKNRDTNDMNNRVKRLATATILLCGWDITRRVLLS